MSTNSVLNEPERIIIRLVKENDPRNVRQLIALVKEQLHLSEDEILAAVLNLQSQGKLRLDSSTVLVSQKLSEQIKTGKALWYWATLVIAVLTVAIVFIVPEDFYPWSYLRNTLGLIFVLWLPGYSIVKALFPKQMPLKTSSENLDIIERIALSIGMSMAVVPMVGLLLYYTPWGIGLAPVVLSLFTLTLISATAAVIREARIKRKVQTSD